MRRNQRKIRDKRHDDFTGLGQHILWNLEKTEQQFHAADNNDGHQDDCQDFAGGFDAGPGCQRRHIGNTDVARTVGFAFELRDCV